MSTVIENRSVTNSFQSLFSLSEPIVGLQHLATNVRPGGLATEGNSRRQKFRDGFQLKSRESTGKGVRRLIRRQIDNLNYLLEQSRSGRDCVHEIRKTFTKTRALLRLCGAVWAVMCIAVKTRVCGMQPHCIETLVTPRRWWPALIESGNLGAADDVPWNQIHGRLVTDAQRSAIVLASHNTVETTSAMVSEFSSRLRIWKPALRHWTDLLRGVKKTYRSGRRAFQQAGTKASVENLHEWRKQAKYLWHEFEVIERVGPRVIRGYGKKLHELTRVLGDDHDLAALRTILDGIRIAQTAAGRLARSIDRRREEL